MNYTAVRRWVLDNPHGELAATLRVALVRYRRTLKPIPIREYLDRVRGEGRR
jgi:hypothetical protein